MADCFRSGLCISFLMALCQIQYGANLTRALPVTQIVLVNVRVLVIVHVHEHEHVHDSQNQFSAKNNTNFRAKFLIVLIMTHKFGIEIDPDTGQSIRIAHRQAYFVISAKVVIQSVYP